MLYDYYGSIYKFNQQKGRFGIEIETETSGLDTYKGALFQSLETGAYETKPKSNFWSPKSDGSLRNFGIEYVLKKPHDITGVEMALTEFEKLFEGVAFIKNAPATSVHVHVNMQNLTIRQIGNFVILWTLFENILVEYSGEPRRSNLFTLPMRCAEGNVKHVVNLFRRLERKEKAALNIDESWAKYAAMNLASLSRFGTIEIRCFRGETDKAELLSWIEILDKLYEYAASGASPPDIVARYGSIGFDLFYEVFKNKAETILQKVSNPVEMIDRNVFYAAVMADAVSDWDHIDPISFSKPEPRAKKMTTEEWVAMHVLPTDPPMQWNVTDGVPVAFGDNNFETTEEF